MPAVVPRQTYSAEEIRKWKAIIYGANFDGVTTCTSKNGQDQEPFTTTPRSSSRPKWGGSQTTPKSANQNDCFVQGESPWGTSKKSYRAKAKGKINRPSLY
mmetsp:Transcript_21069/g.24311  ORF Transcript_21069/g.24311 Transcript_21069/m.24311 type:complete len:101 (+) Transcript_21069:61-363(+)